MEKVIEKYNEYIKNEKKTWETRFIWRGLGGNAPKYTTTINKFFNETNIIEKSDKAENVNNLFLLVESWAEAYITWVSEKNNSYSKKEYENMRNFFIGAIGEFFFVTLLNDVKSLMIPIGDLFERFDFNYVAPMLSDDEDFGVDLTGVANDTASIFQVKFWNPFGNSKASIKLFQGADSQGCRENLINKDDDNNIFLCWLGSESMGKNRIDRVKFYKNKIVVIGKETLEASINDRNKIFWNNFYKKLADICR